MTESERIFEEHRTLLEGIAYRMCGVLADAQDVVQETYLRWCRMAPSEVREPRSWLVTACSRLAMDLLKSARVKREAYVGPWLPDPFLDQHSKSPAEQACIDETVSMALMLALEKLSPSERAAFLLHEVFAYGFDDIAAILEKSEPACRKLASRARASIRSAGVPRYEASAEEHRNLLTAFVEAAQSGEINNLKTLLTTSVELHADGGGVVKTSPIVLTHAEDVAQFFVYVWRENVSSPESIQISPRWFNGQPGLLIFQEGQLVVALSFAVQDGKISRIYALRHPGKLAPFCSA